MHIPQSNPFVTKLASAAADVIDHHGCDAIFAYYMEPYGMAAHLASQWTGVPYAIRHAGSDFGRLLKQRDLRRAYREILKGAHCVWSGLAPETFLALGVDEKRLLSSRPGDVPAIFNPDAPPMDFNKILQEWPQSGIYNASTRRLDPAIPTIGIYGKVGERKGSFDLVRSLANLKRKGYDFNFVAMTQGRDLALFVSELRAAEMEDRTAILPFLPHWRVPGFMRACTAVCFLERDFPIAFHGPTVPREVLATGTCLLLSGEIAAKQRYLRSQLRDGETFLLVEDPKELVELETKLGFVLENPDRARQIGAAGCREYRAAHLEMTRTTPGSDVDLLERRLAELSADQPRRRHMGAFLDADQPAGSLARRLPWTRALLGEQWDRLVRDYLDTGSTSADRFGDAVQFCEFLASRISKCFFDGAHRYVADVVKYEAIHNSIYVQRKTPGPPDNQQDKRWGFGALRRNRNANGRLRVEELSSDELLCACPALAEGVRIEQFEHNLLRFGKPRGPLSEVPREATFVLFKPEPNFVNVELQIDEGCRDLLVRANGARTLADILRELFAPVGSSAAKASDEELLDEVRRLLRRLTALDVLRLIRPKDEPEVSHQSLS
jgi:glycosyltransferase involved in cell wall biosynthesis